MTQVSTRSAEEPVILQRRGVLGVMVLNRPRALNALTTAMVKVMTEALTTWAADPSVETVVVLGAGDRGLCAGGDVSAFYQDAVNGTAHSETFWREEYRLNSLISSYPKPYVALMDGITLGGGVGVSAHGSHRVVTERTRLGMPEVGIGFLPDVGGTWLLSRAPGELGTYLALTGRHVGAGDVIEVGLADHYVAAARLPRLLDLLETTHPDQALADVSEPAPPGMLRAMQAEIDTDFAHYDPVQIVAALRHRGDEWADSTLAALADKSPSSLMLTLRALRAAREMESLEDALRQEFRAASRLLRTHDLREGIRAQVIDKDRRPTWKPATLADVEPASVEAILAPAEHELTFGSDCPDHH